MSLQKTPSAKTNRLPSVDVLLRHALLAESLARHGHTLTRHHIRLVLGALRGSKTTASLPEIAARVQAAIAVDLMPSLKAVFNLTGTVLHTNLGRAPLPKAAIEAMVIAAGAVNLEYDLNRGARGQRDHHVERWICRLTGAEAAIVVNNNAAAVLIVLNTLAKGRQAIVSRGELIEIGGAFRLPDIMENAGCILREVGTTNRTHAKDYQNALGAETGVILKAHTSNYQVQGFTSAVDEAELAHIALDGNVPLVIDLGSGTLTDLTDFGLPHEVTVRESLAGGADLVTFSGDKLLGGPQAGIIAGRADLIAKIAENPMKRALRLDKITLAALEAVLRLYAHPENLLTSLPTLALLARSQVEIKTQVETVLPEVRAALTGRALVRSVECRSQIGSGALPVDLLPSFALALEPVEKTDAALRLLARSLRQLPRPILGRIHKGAVLLDLRNLVEDAVFLEQISLLKTENSR